VADEKTINNLPPSTGAVQDQSEISFSDFALNLLSDHRSSVSSPQVASRAKLTAFSNLIDA
jgi:hypothetical protein